MKKFIEARQQRRQDKRDVQNLVRLICGSMYSNFRDWPPGGESSTCVSCYRLCHFRNLLSVTKNCPPSERAECGRSVSGPGLRSPNVQRELLARRCECRYRARRKDE